MFRQPFRRCWRSSRTVYSPEPVLSPETGAVVWGVLIRTISCSFCERRCHLTMTSCLVHWEDDLFRSASSGAGLCLGCRRRLHSATNVLSFFFFWWQRVPDSPTLLLRWINGLSDTFWVVFPENVPIDSWKKLLWLRSCLFLSSMEKRGEIRIQFSCLTPAQGTSPVEKSFSLYTKFWQTEKGHTHTYTQTHTHMLVGLGNSLTSIAFYMQMSAVLFSCSLSDRPDIGLWVLTYL